MTIQLDNVSKQFGKVQVLQPTSLKLTQKFTTILGESGCGKTTLLKMIAGLETPTAGRITLNEKIVTDQANGRMVAPNKRSVSMVFQDFALWPHLSLAENVGFGLKKQKLSKEAYQERIHACLKMVKLDHLSQRKPGQLSGGQQQRVALARALAPQPAVILFDEPLSALDAVLREQMQTEIVQLIQESSSQALFVTHDQKEAMTMSDEIVVMEKGVVSQQGTPTTIYQAPANEYVAHFIGKVNQLDRQTLIRPEHLSVTPQDAQAQAITGTVLRQHYFGDEYRIFIQMEQGIWQFPSLTPMAIGTKCTLYYQPKQTILVGEK